ncbi:hypothetical protein I553_3884 [Mycobacterium xenopi 4042]|uniref:Uncharacterized protein n=1 Tax=Mycobacterium xenopi 4042 TaxID=1299334 RepID=X8DB62_MYCXE|nr:hypothetical protein I553_3884 [Mycobacterium xenopi 4042]
MWRYFGDNRMFLIGPRPRCCRTCSPNSGKACWITRCSSPTPPPRQTLAAADLYDRIRLRRRPPGPQVRDFHHEIKGQMPDGSATTRWIPRPITGRMPPSSSR